MFVSLFFIYIFSRPDIFPYVANAKFIMNTMIDWTIKRFDAYTINISNVEKIGAK